jgi:CRP/FNR family transcriptional regulator, cyclic AMP receptor protein
VPLTQDTEVWQRRLAAFPLASYGAGETVFSEGTKTGRLLILKTGRVSIVKGGTEITQVAEPGVVFGEISALLDQPHTADVRTLEPSQFHVADAAAFLVQDPAALLYVATTLARRLDDTNQAFLELKAQLQAREPAGLIDEGASGSDGPPPRIVGCRLVLDGSYRRPRIRRLRRVDPSAGCALGIVTGLAEWYLRRKPIDLGAIVD